MSESKPYHCFNCGEDFGNIPAFGCPSCGSENYVNTQNVNNIPADDELFIGSMM